MAQKDDKDKNIVPWQFQKKTVRLALGSLEAGERVLIVSPGGSGKTVMAGMLVLAAASMRAAARMGKRVLMISHRREIITQTYDHLVRMGVSDQDIGLLYGDAPSARVRPRARIQIASVQTLYYMERLPSADIVIVDECHRVMAPGYQRLVQKYARARHVGLTATPHRLDGRGLGDFYDTMHIATTPSALIRAKRMTKPVLAVPTADEFVPDIRNVRVARGDYVASDLEARVMKGAIVGNIPVNWRLHANGRQTVGFGVTIAHSQLMTETCKAAGISAVHVDGEMSKAQRDSLIAEFRRGRHKILFNCMLLSEGWDVPECDAVILARPTKSLVLYLQQVYRCMRYHGGRAPVVLDHAGLFVPFGNPHYDRPWTLTAGQADPEVTGGGGLKVCSECRAVVSRSAETCSRCGHEFVIEGRALFPEEIDILLRRQTAARQRQLVQRLRAFAKTKGWTQDWVDEMVRIWASYQAPGKAA